jgi:hypothetical protein
MGEEIDVPWGKTEEMRTDASRYVDLGRKATIAENQDLWEVWQERWRYELISSKRENLN